MSEFYIGYLDKAPPAQGAWVRRVVVGLLLFAPLFTAALASAQRGYAAAVFEYGVPRTLEGVYVAWPTPTLLIPRPGQTGEEPWSALLLVGEGKHGVDASFAGLDGHQVRLTGTLIYREEQSMAEVQGLPEDLGEAPALQDSRALGTQTLVGEIVDSKCFLGVMNPGNLKPHRDCAVRCLSGGIPPILLVRQPDGATRHVLVVGAHGEPIGRALLDRVAEPLQVTGALETQHGQWILRADPSAFQRLE